MDKCYSPSSFWDDKTDSTNMSHEIRLSSPTDWRMRFVGGLFYEDRTVEAKRTGTTSRCRSARTAASSTGNCFLYLDPRAAPKFQSAADT